MEGGALKRDSDMVELVGRMRDGDADALVALYDRYATVAYSVAYRIARNSADAEDIVQESFLQAWQQAYRFDSSRATVSGWLLMITRSRALDRARRMSGSSRWKEGSARLEQLSAGPEWATDHALMREQDGREVRERFDALPACERIAVELAFYEGLTHCEIADVLCQPLGTVKTRIRMGIHRMRDRLNGATTGTPPRTCEPSPFTVALAAYLARRPRLTVPYRSLSGVRILVVDDDAETADLVTTMLQSAGATVMTARSTRDGLSRLGQVWPDVIVADLAMPDDDGYDLIREAQMLAEPSGRRLTAIAFTGLGEREQARALRAGFASFVSKPIQPHALVDVVTRLTNPPG